MLYYFSKLFSSTGRVSSHFFFVVKKLLTGPMRQMIKSLIVAAEIELTILCYRCKQSLNLLDISLAPAQWSITGSLAT